MREQDPKVRVTNFEEVCQGYTLEEAQLEASRCLHCRKPRCVEHCPVSVQIPEFIAELAAGDLAAAAAVIAEDSSLPSVCGRVCPQETQCEGSCVLGVKGEPVAIGKLERFVGDWALEHPEELDSVESSAPNGHKVAIVGSGPAGLACASDLAKMGYDVTIFEALHKAGGVLEYGIPEFRLPKSGVVAREIENVRRLGVRIETDVIVGRTVTIDELMDREGFEVVFIGSGAGREEVHHAKEEGIAFHMLCNPIEVIGDEKGWVRGVRCIRMELGEPDASGRRSPVEIPGSEFEMPCDVVIMALGTSPNPLIASTTAGLETTRRGCLVADEEYGATTRPGVFAGGDTVTGAATVILAMGAGRKAALGIDRYLRGKE